MSFNSFYFNPEIAAVDITQNSSTSTKATQQINFNYSRFVSERDNKPQLVSQPWEEFCKTFTKHQERAYKSGGPCWSPALFKDGTTRKNENVLSLCMAVIDVDNGTPITQLTEKLLGFTYLIHSSYSHTREHPKYRVIFPLSKPIWAIAWSEAWTRINNWLGNVNDPATKDASRIYFMPACPTSSQDHFAFHNAGKLLDVTELPAVSRQEYQFSSSNSVRFTTNDPLGSIEQLQAVRARCCFIQQASASENQPLVREPLWMAMISNCSRFEGGEGFIHEASCHHPGYDEEKTDSKISHCRNGSAPITCKRIQDWGFKECPNGGCKLPSGSITKAPAGLGVWSDSLVKNIVDGSGNLEAAPGMPKWLEQFLEKYYPAGLMFINGSFYGYEKGYWPRLDEQADIRRSIANFLGTEANPSKIGALLVLCRDFRAVKDSMVASNLNLICLENGALDVIEAKLIEHNPNHYLICKSPILWDPTASCDRWLKFLEEIFANDEDQEEKIAFLKMWFGYCLIPDSSQHKFVWMVGAGGNGKSVLLSILTQLIGKTNVSHAHIERLDDKYVRAELQGKLVNISSEMSADATLSDGYLKAIVSGDEIEAERKYMPSFSFKPYVRLIGATNHLPRLMDLSSGFARRAVILKFNRQFSESEMDPNLETALLKELPGILKWAVEGLSELRALGKFDVPQSSIEALTQYRSDSDPVKLFADECLTQVDTGGLFPTELYSAYRSWCGKSGFASMNKINFGKRLSDLGFTKRRSMGKDYWLVDLSNDFELLWLEGIPRSPFD